MRYGRLVEAREPGNVDPARGREAPGRINQLRDGVHALTIVGVPDIEAAAARAGDHIGRAGRSLDPSDRRHQPRLLPRPAFDLENPLGGGRDRIASCEHGCCARVVRGAGKDDLTTRQTDDRIHDSEG